MITMNDSAAANIILQSRQAGVPASQRFVANNAAASASFLRIGGKAVEGTLIGTDALPEIRTDALAKTFVANFQKKYNATPDQWNAVGYTIGKLYGHAIAAVKGPVTRQAINDAVVATGLPGGAGQRQDQLQLQRADREPTYEPILITVKDGKFIPAPVSPRPGRTRAIHSARVRARLAGPAACSKARPPIRWRSCRRPCRRRPVPRCGR
jgi:branched-chain amino acid transport system substrate-binding protein